MIKLKRIYEQSARNDSVRVLVDRMWPRGIATQDAGVDIWLKEIAPRYHGTSTLLFAARDEDHNNAVALGEFLEEQMQR